MKKLLAMLMTLCLLSSLFGCAGPAIQDTVAFYYPRHADAVSYGRADGVIAPESRELAGRNGDLRYLLSLYLSGPLDDTLSSPFPEGTVVDRIISKPDQLTVILSSEFSQLSGIDLTVACACISATCFGLSDVGSVTVMSGQTELYPAVSMTFTRDSLTLIDESADLSQPQQKG